MNVHPEFAVEDDCLVVGGVPLHRLAARAGRTPFFAYDRSLITKRVGLLRRNLPEQVHLSYAVKANPMPAVVHHLASLVDGFDLASAGELKMVLDTGFPPENLSFAGPGKTKNELVQAVASGITINAESETEISTLAAAGEDLGLTPRVAVRVNPGFDLRASGMKMGGGAKQFGIDAERVPESLRRIGELNLDFQGFHIFCGSQNLRADAIRESQTKTIELAIELAERSPAPVRKLNIGGGFGIPYLPGEEPLDLAQIGAGLEELAPKVEARLPDAKLIIELGRYLVGEAGIYVCQVVDKKVSRGETFLITNGGLHHHLAASGNFGQVIRRNFPVAVGTKMNRRELEVVNVVGCLCTPLDLLAHKVDLPRSEIGDLVVIFQSGAYGLTASPTAFLSHPAPIEVLV